MRRDHGKPSKQANPEKTVRTLESPTSDPGEPDVGPWRARRRTLESPTSDPGEPDVGPWPRRRLRVPIEGIAIGERELAKETAVYVARVHRLGEGDVFTAFDPEQAIEADAVIVESSGRSVRVRIEGARAAEVVAPRAVTLVQALGKGDKLDAIVRDATELGVSRIVPVIAERSVVRPVDASARLSRWRRIAVEAARQCGRGDTARIDAVSPLIEAVRALAPEHGRGDAGAWGACLVPGAPALLGQMLLALPAKAPFTIVVGPEGGLAPGEIEACEAAGLACVGLGALVLRTETVCAAVLGALLVLDASPGAGTAGAERHN